MEDQFNLKVLGSLSQLSPGSGTAPNFPQPPHERPPFFPALDERGRSLDHPDLIATSRKHEIFQTTHLRSTFEMGQSSRLSKLSRLLSTQNKNHVVLVMMVNLGFMQMFRNWVRGCEEEGIDPRAWALILALDLEAGRQVTQMGFTVFSDQFSYGEQPKEAAAEYGNEAFTRLMFAKTAIVQDVLLAGYHVLFQDADIVWKKDPLNFFLHPSRQELDAQFMYDGPNPYYEPLHANSGFFFLKNTPESKIFWNLVFENYDKILHYGSQQKVVNIVLLSRFFRGLKIDILPERDFANGHLFCEDRPLRLPNDPYVIHCSWTRNIQHKIEKYKNANLWYL